MGTHSVLAPSSAHRWAKCYASAKAEADDPSPESPAAREGTAAHWVLQEVLEDRLPTIGEAAPNGVPVTEEMIDGAMTVFMDVVETLGDGWRELVRVEKQLAIPDVHPQCFGTPDIVAFDAFTIYVWDYKFGHRFVDAYENRQLILYALGAFGSSPLKDWEDRTNVVAKIVQPRNYHPDGPIREWRCKMTDLRAYRNILAHAASQAMGDNPLFNAGAEQCRDCSVAYKCNALRQAAYRILDEPYPDQLHELSPLELSNVYKKMATGLDLLKALSDGVGAKIESLLRSGSRVPGYALTPGRSNAVWDIPADVVAALSDEIDLLKPREAITPAQAIKKGLDSDLVGALSTRPPASLKLTEVDTKKAEKVFK